MLFQVLSVVGALMVLTAYALIQSGIWRELDAGYLAYRRSRSPNRNERKFPI